MHDSDTQICVDTKVGVDSIDIDTPDPIFEPLAWICAGKNFPTDANIPRFIANAYKMTYDVPADQRTHLLQDHHRPIRSFAVTSLPPPSPSLSFATATLWFSEDAPCSDVSLLLHRPVPHPQVLRELKKISGQKWFDGCQSIRDLRFNKGQERFPLWALGLWLAFSTQNDIQRRWRAALSWVDEQFITAALPQTTETFRETKRLLTVLP